MPENKLKTAVLGLNDNGRLLLEAALKANYFQLEAVADKDTQLVERIGREYNCRAYDDYRQLVIQNQLDCLLVAAGMNSCGEHLRSAIKKKFNILKWPPLARNFEEAVELVRLAEDNNVKFAITNINRFADSFVAFRQFIQQGRIEHIYLLTAECNVGGHDYPAWHNDKGLSGGGVLLRNCYGIFDEIVCNFPTPQEVYALNTSTAGDKHQRHYLTEDTSIVTMKFREDMIGNLTASKVVGPDEAYLKVFGKAQILTVNNNLVRLSKNCGEVVEDCEYGYDILVCTKRLLENFALSILSPDKNKLCSTGRENLKNMSVIESAYLSSRTSMPESPARVLQMGQAELTKIVD
ncbi:Gfo/Idh/MocA family protein [Planctomycetota bacterium]